MGGTREREVDHVSSLPQLTEALLPFVNENMLGEPCYGVLELFTFSFQPELGLLPTPSPPPSG